MKKALFLSHLPILPVIGGDRIRLSQTLTLLAGRAQVDVVCITHDNTPRPSLKEAISGVMEEKYFYIPRMKRYFNAAKTLLNHKPEIANHYWHAEVQGYIDSVVGEYDVIVCGSPAMASYFLGSGMGNVYVDFTDSLTLNYEHAAAVSKGLFRLVSRADAKRMRKFEAACREQFCRVAYISCRDRDYIGEDASRTCILKNWVEMPEEGQCCNYNEDTQDIIFVGKMDYAPNIEACEYFVREVFPLVRRECGQARFAIVGMSPTSRVRQLGRENDSVVVTGRVNTVSAFYRNAAVVVAPMVSGSGLQNKIIEAMAHGCAVVTTSTGANGLDSEAQGLVISDDAEEMARVCVNMLKDKSLRAKTGALNRKYAAEFYSKEAAAGQFEKFVEI